MYRKRILSVISAAVLLLSGCGINDSSDNPQNSGEIPETTSFSATENVPENEITQDTIQTAETAPENAVSAEITTSATAAATTAATEPLSKEERISQSLKRFKENTYIAELPPCDVDMSEYKGKFYEWEYDESIVSETESDFPAEVIESAHAAVDKYFIELLLQETEKQEESNLVGQSEAYVMRLRYPALGQLMLWYYNVAGDDYNKCFEGDCGFEFREAACADFDGDGNEEYFIIFEKPNPFDVPISLMVFVNHEGTIEVLNDAGLLGASLCPVKYTGGFTHMLICSGYNTSTIHTSFYAVENGSAVYKHHEHKLPSPYNGVFMKELVFLLNNAEWLIFWNEELNEYCSFLGNPITDDEAEALFEAYAIGSPDEPSLFSGIYKDCGKYRDAQTLQLNTRKIGDLYCVQSDVGWYTCYEYRDGSFFPSEEYLRPADTVFGEMYAEGIDFEYLERNTISIE